MQRDGERRLWSAQYSLSLLLLLPPTAWGIPVGCGDPRTAAAWVLCRGCSPSGVGSSSVGAPQAPCSYCQKSCSRLLLPWYSTACREMSCFTDLQWLWGNPVGCPQCLHFLLFLLLLLFSHCAHSVFPRTFSLAARQCFSVPYTSDSCGAPLCPVVGLLEPAVLALGSPGLSSQRALQPRPHTPGAVPCP